MSDESETGRKLAKLRWANATEAQKKAHAELMLLARWGKRRKRLHRAAKVRAKG